MYPPDKDSASRGRSYLALGEARVFGPPARYAATTMASSPEKSQMTAKSRCAAANYMANVMMACSGRRHAGGLRKIADAHERSAR